MKQPYENYGQYAPPRAHFGPQYAPQPLSVSPTPWRINKPISPSYPVDSGFLGGKRQSGQPLPSPEKEAADLAKEREVASANIWLLVPAIVGAGASFLLLLMTDGIKAKANSEKNGHPEECVETRDPRLGTAVIVIYSGIVTAGVSTYIFKVMTATDGHPITAFIPAASAIMTLIFYFAAAYALEYHVVQGSFKGENIGDNSVAELISFTYFSITTFATAAMGDIAPISIGSKILVSIEVLFFVFIFTMGIVFFTAD